MLDAILLLLPPEIAAVVSVRYDLRAVAVAASLSLLSALVFGGVPALQAARVGLVTSLKEGGSVRGSGRARGRLKQGLVVAEVALSAVLLVATGLLLRSFWTLLSVSPGFGPTGVLAASLSPAGEAYRESARVQDFYRGALERLRQQPGVTSAAAISWTPRGGGGAAASFTISGREAPLRGQEPVADIRIVTPGLFETLRIPLLHGRDLGPDDRVGSPRVAVIGDSLARELGPPGAALGQRLDAVADGVLEQRLQQQAWHDRVRREIGNLPAHLQALAEAQLFDALGLAEAIAASVRDITKLCADVALVDVGALPNDGKVIEDARSYK